MLRSCPPPESDVLFSAQALMILVAAGYDNIYTETYVLELVDAAKSTDGTK
jgi:hypothetical protein